jgi:hypothetical protein
MNTPQPPSLSGLAAREAKLQEEKAAIDLLRANYPVTFLAPLFQKVGKDQPSLSFGERALIIFNAL